MAVGDSVLVVTRTPLDDFGDQLDRGGGMAGSGGDVISVDLAVAVQRQEQAQWCWAAVAVSVAAHYDSGTHWRQCDIVDAELGLSTCCDEGDSAHCNVPWFLDRALARTGHLREMTRSAVDFSRILAELIARQPLGVRIGWTGGRGHFVAIVGIRDRGSHRLVRVGDPFRGTVDEAWTEPFPVYLGLGFWTHTYLTQP